MNHAKDYEYLIDEIFAKARDDNKPKPPQTLHPPEQPHSSPNISSTPLREEEEETKEKQTEPTPNPPYQFNYLDIKDDDINLNIDNTNLHNFFHTEDEKDETELLNKLKHGINEVKEGKFLISTTSDDVIDQDRLNFNLNQLSKDPITTNNTNKLTSSNNPSVHYYKKQTQQLKSKSVNNVNKHSKQSAENQIRTYLSQNLVPMDYNMIKSKNSNSNSKYHKYNTEQLAYDANKNFSQCRPKEKNFLSRMKFYAIKQQTRNDVIHILIEKNKPKIKESEKLKTFNRLIEDSNRRAEAKNRIEMLNANKQIAINIYNQDYNLSKQKKHKFNLLEFEKKYEEEVTNKLKAKRKAIEQQKMKQEKEMILKEEKILNEMKKYHKKATDDEINKISQRLYNDAIARKIKLNEMRARSQMNENKFGMLRHHSESKFNNKHKRNDSNNNNNNKVNKHNTSFYSEEGINNKLYFKSKRINNFNNNNKQQHTHTHTHSHINININNISHNNSYIPLTTTSNTAITGLTTEKPKMQYVPYYNAERMINAFFKPKQNKCIN